MQELFKLLNEGKYEEALNGFKKVYLSTNNPIALYYSTFIEYHYIQNYNVDELYNNFKALYKYNKDTRIKVYDFYLAFLMDHEDYDLARKVSLKSLKETGENFINCYSYSRSLQKLNKKLNVALDYAIRSTSVEELNETQKLVVYANLIEIYCLKKEYNQAKNIINKLYLFSNNIPYISLIELQVAISEENDEEIAKLTANNLKYEENKFEAIKLLCQYYYESDQYDIAIEYHKMLKIYLSSPSFANEKLAILFLYSDKFDDGIKLLKEEPLENMAANNYLLGNLYYYKGGRSNYLLAINHYKQALEVSEDKEKVLTALGDVYTDLIDIKNLKDISNQLTKINSHGFAAYFDACIYRLTQQFDKASKLIKTMKRNKVDDYRINLIIKTCSDKPEKVSDYYNDVFNKNDKHSLREKIEILSFGKYGNKIDMNKAKIYIEELEKKENLSGCDYSVIASFYLLKNEDKKAYEYAKIGYEKYLHGEETCQCCGAIIAYLKYKGRGIEKDIDEAYNIFKLIHEKECNDLNENIVHIYAMLSIELNKDLEVVYNLLEKTAYRKYSTSRLFMLIKIGKLLNKDISNYNKLFKESLKHCCQREFEYYSKQHDDFMFNNY